ncbi:hypothetical protein LguiB_008878 [Lonicera macranthoides]
MPRYGYRAVVTTPPSSPSAGQRVEAADFPAEKDQPQMVEGLLAEQVEEEPDRSWRPVFRYQSRELLESDSIYCSPSVAATIMYGITKADDICELKDIPTVQLRNEALQDMLKNEALTQLDAEKKRLNEQLKEKKKELDTVNGLISSLNQQLGCAQGEVSFLRSDHLGLKEEVERLMKENSDLKAEKDQEIADAE